MSASAMADETTRPRGRAVQAALNNRLTPRDGQILDYWLNGLRKTADRSPTKLEEIRPLMDALRWAMRNSRIG